jgi:hypothetical protein
MSKKEEKVEAPPPDARVLWVQAKLAKALVPRAPARLRGRADCPRAALLLPQTPPLPQMPPLPTTTTTTTTSSSSFLRGRRRGCRAPAAPRCRPARAARPRRASARGFP